MSSMFVVKRDGRTEPVHFDKITARITKLSYGLNPEFCDPVSGRGAGVARRARGCSRAPAWPRGGGGGRGGARARPQITRAACLNEEPGAKFGRGRALLQRARRPLSTSCRLSALPGAHLTPSVSGRRGPGDGRGRLSRGERARARLLLSRRRSCVPSLPPPQVLVAQKVATGVYKGVTTTELDELAAETAASMTANHPDYAVVSRGGACFFRSSPLGSRPNHTTPPPPHPPQLAARIAVSNLHKNTLKSFSET